MTEQWQELKETITEMRDSNGTCTQQEVCKFLVNYMEILEKQMKEPKTGRWEYIQYYKPSIGNWHCSECGRIVFLLKSQKFDETPLYDYCPWCGAKMESEEKENG